MAYHKLNQAAMQAAATAVAQSAAQGQTGTRNIQYFNFLPDHKAQGFKQQLQVTPGQAIASDNVFYVLPPWSAAGLVSKRVATHWGIPAPGAVNGLKARCLHLTWGTRCPVCEAMDRIRARYPAIRLDRQSPGDDNYANVFVPSQPQLLAQIVNLPTTVHNWLLLQLSNPQIGDITDPQAAVPVNVHKSVKLRTKKGNRQSFSDYRVEYTPSFLPQRGPLADPSLATKILDALWDLDRIWSPPNEEEMLELQKTAAIFEAWAANQGQGSQQVQVPLNLQAPGLPPGAPPPQGWQVPTGQPNFPPSTPPMQQPPVPGPGWGQPPATQFTPPTPPAPSYPQPSAPPNPGYPQQTAPAPSYPAPQVMTATGLVPAALGLPGEQPPPQAPPSGYGWTQPPTQPPPHPNQAYQPAPQASAPTPPIPTSSAQPQPQANPEPSPSPFQVYQPPAYTPPQPPQAFPQGYPQPSAQPPQGQPWSPQPGYAPAPPPSTIVPQTTPMARPACFGGAAPRPDSKSAQDLGHSASSQVCSMCPAEFDCQRACSKGA